MAMTEDDYRDQLQQLFPRDQRLMPSCSRMLLS